MLSLFESDADFLDDITAGQGTMGPVGMQTPMGPRMPQNTPSQYTPLGGGQKMQHYNSQYEYDQFAQQQNFSGMNDGRQASMSQMMNTSPQKPFGSPPPQGSRMQSPGPNFQGYGMHGNNQQVTPPQQVQQQGQVRAQIGMSPGPGTMWNQGNSLQQGNKAMPGQVPYVQQQSSSQPMQGYMSHHDYNSLSTSHAAQAASQMNRFPSQQPRQMYGRSPMGSPPPTAPQVQRLSHIPISNQGNVDPTGAGQFPSSSQAGILGGQGTPGMLNNMNNYPSNAQPRGMMPGAHMQGMMRGNTPAYPYGPQAGQMSQVQAQQQAGLQAQQQQAGLPRVGQVPSNGPMSPYQSQSSGQNAYRQPFPGLCFIISKNLMKLSRMIIIDSLKTYFLGFNFDYFRIQNFKVSFIQLLFVTNLFVNLIC